MSVVLSIEILSARRVMSMSSLRSIGGLPGAAVVSSSRQANGPGRRRPRRPPWPAGVRGGLFAPALP